MRSTLVSISLVPLLALLAGVACNRAPAEPAPVASSRAQQEAIGAPASAPGRSSDDGSAALRDRCIVPTPDTPPPAVPKGPARGCPSDPGGATAMSTATISFPEAKDAKGPLKVPLQATVELARAEDQRERGLMYRTSMPEDHGMLFEMEAQTIHHFWMRNTCIPLDMFFVDPDGLIVGLLENVPTLNTDERAVACPSSYVLEMNAGWARRHGVRAGQRLVLPTH